MNATKRKTQAELLAHHREDLDAAWHAKYPRGQFCLQEFRGEQSLHWLPRRPTSRATPHGVSVRESPEHGIVRLRHRKSSFGKTRNFDTCETLFAVAKRAGFSVDLISAFEDAMRHH